MELQYLKKFKNLVHKRPGRGIKQRYVRRQIRSAYVEAKIQVSKLENEASILREENRQYREEMIRMLQENKLYLKTLEIYNDVKVTKDVQRFYDTITSQFSNMSESRVCIGRETTISMVFKF